MPLLFLLLRRGPVPARLRTVRIIRLGGLETTLLAHPLLLPPLEHAVVGVAVHLVAAEGVVGLVCYTHGLDCWVLCFALAFIWLIECCMFIGLCWLTARDC